MKEIIDKKFKLIWLIMVILLCGLTMFSTIWFCLNGNEIVTKSCLNIASLLGILIFATFITNFVLSLFFKGE